MNKSIILIAIALCSCNNPGQAAKEVEPNANVDTAVQQRRYYRQRSNRESQMKKPIDLRFATRFRDLTLSQALDTAKAEGKRVLVNFHTKTCGPCRMMEQTVFTQKECGDYFNANYICISLDGEEGEGQKVAKENSVEIYPTYVIFESDGTPLCSVVGATKDGNKFLDKIKTALSSVGK